MDLLLWVAGKSGVDAGDVPLLCRADGPAVVQIDGRFLADVKRLTFGKALLDINQDNFIGYFAISKHIGTGGAHISGTDNGYFHGIKFRLFFAGASYHSIKQRKR